MRKDAKFQEIFVILRKSRYMIIPTWLPFVVCAIIAAILLTIIYYRPLKSKKSVWQWINKHIIGVFGGIVMSAIFIPILISWTAPRIWIVRAEKEMDEKLIVFGYNGLSVGMSRRYLENGTPETLVVEKIFYGEPKPEKESNDEIFHLRPNESIRITGEPCYGKPGRTIIDRHYGAAHKYGRFQWFIHKPY